MSRFALRPAALVLPLLSIAWVVHPWPVGAQEAAAPTEGGGELFFDTVDVQVVNIEVLVTDSDGNPVTDLTREDFEIFEDGEPVEITNFFAVRDRSAVAAGAAEGSGDILPTPETRSLFLVAFVDNLHIRPQNRNRIFEELKTFVRDQLDPRDRVMLVSFDGQIQVIQKFTNDVDELDSALAEIEKQMGNSQLLDIERQDILRRINRASLVTPSNQAGQGLDQGAFDTAQLVAQQLVMDIRHSVDRTYQNVAASVEGIQRFTDSLAGLPGRKAVLYISDGVPTRPGEALIQAWMNQFENWALANNATEVLRSMNRLRQMTRDTTPLFRQLVQQASARRVAFYPISNASRDRTGRTSAEFLGGGTADGRSAFSEDVQNIDTFSRESSLLSMAHGTGGIAFTRSSHLGGLMNRMVQDFTTFYSLGYAPPNPDDQGYHRVEVKVRREGLEVRHVKGYQEIDPMQEMENLTLSALFYDFEDNPLDISLLPGQHAETASGMYRVPLLIRFPFEKVVLLPQEGFYTGRLIAFVVVQDDEGNLSPFQRIMLPIRIPEAQYEQAVTGAGGYQVDLLMRKGKHRISVGVRDEIADLETTVNLELDVGLGREAAAAGGIR